MNFPPANFPRFYVFWLALAAIAPLWWRPAVAAAAWDRPAPLIPTGFAYARISAGRLRGVAVDVAPGRRAHIFKHIPYAEPPLGRLRFRRLRAARRWGGDWDATTYGPACPSNTSQTTSPQEHIDEDCVHANVFADAKCMHFKHKCPVLFYIHGGGFYYDSAVMFNDQQIVDKYASDGVVFVIAAYRLGVFAALDVGDEDVVPSNLALNDIIFALNWTRNEIAAFGGDARRITVMGNSGGASAVALLMVHRRVPMSLFRRAIISSGVLETESESGALRNFTNAILSRFNCSEPRVFGARPQVDCLRYVNATSLLEAQRVLVDEKGFTFNPITATEDLPIDDYGKIMRHWKPRTLWISVTKDEFHPEREASMGMSCREAMSYLGYVTRAVFDECMRFHFGNNTQNANEKLKKDSLVPTSTALQAQSLLNAIVNTRSGGTTFHSSFQLANHSAHADDLLFFFGLHWKNRTYTPAESFMDQYYPKVVKNFLRDGRPESGWDPVDEKGRGYFVFDFALANVTAANASLRDVTPVRGDQFAEPRVQLARWPHFRRAYDAPRAESFWLIDEARVEALAKGIRFVNCTMKWWNATHNSNATGENYGNGDEWAESGRGYDKSNGTNEYVNGTYATLNATVEYSKRKETDENNNPDNKKYSVSIKSKIYRNPNEIQNSRNMVDTVSEKHLHKEHSAAVDQLERYLEKKNGAEPKRNEPWIRASEKSREWAKRYGKHGVNERWGSEKDRMIGPGAKSVEWVVKRAKEIGEEIEQRKTNGTGTSWEESSDEANLGNWADRRNSEDSKDREERKDELLIKPSRTSIEWNKKFRDEKNELKDFLGRLNKKKRKPLIEPSEKSIEWAKEFRDEKKKLKKFLEEKKRKDKPLIKPSETSIEWAKEFRDEKKQLRDLLNGLEKKKGNGEPLIEPSETSIEWAFDKIMNDVENWRERRRKDEDRADRWHRNRDYEDREDHRHFKRDREDREDQDWSREDWDKWNHWIKRLKERMDHKKRDRHEMETVGKERYHFNFTYGGIACVYDSRNRDKLNCTQFNHTVTNGDIWDGDEKWNDDAQNYSNEDDKNYSNEYGNEQENGYANEHKHSNGKYSNEQGHDNGKHSDESAAFGHTKKYGSREKALRKLATPIEKKMRAKRVHEAKQKHRKGTNSDQWLLGNPAAFWWWKLVGHRFYERKWDRNEWRYSDEAQMPPFWLPVLAQTSLVSAIPHFRPVEGLNTTGRYGEFDDVNDIDLRYYNKLERRRREVDESAGQPVPVPEERELRPNELAGHLTNDNYDNDYGYAFTTLLTPISSKFTTKGTSFFWFSVSAAALAISMALIAIVTHVLFGAKRAGASRGYAYADEIDASPAAPNERTRLGAAAPTKYLT